MIPNSVVLDGTRQRARPRAGAGARATRTRTRRTGSRSRTRAGTRTRAEATRARAGGSRSVEQSMLSCFFLALGQQSGALLGSSLRAQRVAARTNVGRGARRALIAGRAAESLVLAAHTAGVVASHSIADDESVRRRRRSGSRRRGRRNSGSRRRGGGDRRSQRHGAHRGLHSLGDLLRADALREGGGTSGGGLVLNHTNGEGHRGGLSGGRGRSGGRSRGS